MELPVLIEPLADRPGYSARLGEPFPLTAEAATPDEARDRLVDALRLRLQQGNAQLLSILVPPPPKGGWLPEDDLTREWRQAVQEFRDECDEADRRRILGDPAEGEAAS